MQQDTTIPNSRRRFISNSLKAAGFAALLLPFQKVFGTVVRKIRPGKNRSYFLVDQLVLNTKTNTVHLPSKKIFTHYGDIAIKNKRIIGLADWENVVKPPVHFFKDKSGIILEVLALQKLVPGINDRNLTAAINTVGIAFTSTYKSNDGMLINKYNFRLHELLATLLALNNSIPVADKWAKFQAATAKIDYSKQEKGFPGYMNWIKTKAGFDRRINYLTENKTDYTARLKERVAKYKL